MDDHHTPDSSAGLLDELWPDGDRLARLQTRLRDEAAAGDLLDLVHRRVDTPVGSLLVASTPVGLVRVAFALEDHDAVLGDLATRISPRILPAGSHLDDVARQLEDWFAGRRHDFDLAVDWQLSSGFRRAVLTHLTDIAWGHTASYGEVAAMADRPRAARAVGTACATNPIPIVVPCHRVVRADGTTGQYRGGRGAKQWLLAHEGGLGSLGDPSQ